MDDRRPDVYLHFDQVSFESQKSQSEIEVALSRAILSDPETGVAAADCVGLDAKHFQIHADMRVVFCACRLAWDRPRDWLLQFIEKGLRAEDEYALIESLERFAKPSTIKPFLLHIGVQLLARDLIDHFVRQRSAMEHVRHACLILKGQAAA